MRISELSRRSGVPVATLKFYIREGVLPAGVATAPNQAEYGEEHVRRLRLARVLREVGRLSVDQIRAVVAAIDDERLPMHELFGVVTRALGPSADDPLPDDVAAATDDVDAFLRDLGWTVGAGAPARRSLAEALAALRRLGRDVGPEVFVPYAKAADAIARSEMDQGPPAGSRAEAVEWVVVGTVVFETALTALRRLAEEHHSAVRSTRGRDR
jgi:DNA-binding transcriptional MerR regulator